MSEQQWIEAQATILEMLHVAHRREAFAEWFELAQEHWSMSQAMECDAICMSPKQY